ncbi:MAG: hypothetical protein IGS38_00980 [Synechococcales cyanobacterium M58_A2018_015]|nr:hypothetical protein [Synechococcales cyanobacterium M58_A2018_015]
MLGESWQTVQRLLLWFSVEGDLAAELQPAIRVIQQTLPRTDLTLWTLEDTLLFQWLQSPLTRVAELRADQFDAAIILTLPHQSPYARAYLCYLADIPIRVGQSHEFGGSVLSHCVQPSLDLESPYDYQLHFLTVLGFPVQPLMVRT